MNRAVIFILAVVFGYYAAAQELHPWYEKNNLGIAFNEDQSEVLVVAHDRVSLWNTADASLIQSSPIPDHKGEAVTSEQFKFIDASPDLSEFVYKVRGTYQRYLMDIEDIDLFPDFQDHKVKEIVGYDTEGWMIFFSEGSYQGFYKVKQQGNMSLMTFLSKEFISKWGISNDHRYVYFVRDQTFRYLNIATKAVTDTGLPAASWKDTHLPPGMVTLYKWNGQKKEGKKVEWRYFIELGKKPGKKLKGKSAQSYFPEDNYCWDSPFWVYGSSKDHHWTIYYQAKDEDRANAAYQYALYKEDRSDCENTLQIIEFSETSADNERRKNNKTEAYYANRKKENQKQQLMKPQLFSEYITKFVPLPQTYTLNYNTIKGVDVTNYGYVQSERYRMNNPQEMA
ncbi:MAG: hypothetical protein AAGH46_11500, partial [Bacteroidota bacterium]